MEMFDGYDNPIENYIPNNLPSTPPCPPKDPCPKPNPCDKLNPCVINKPFADYNVQNELIGYWWRYGETLNLEFNIEQEAIIEDSQEYITAEDFMKGMCPDAVIELYNFRRESIYKLVIPKVDSTTIVFPIGEELSRSLVQGIYYCSLTLINEEMDYCDTIFKQEDCTLTVK